MCGFHRLPSSRVGRWHCQVFGPGLHGRKGKGTVLARKMSWLTVILKLYSTSIVLHPSVLRRPLRQLMPAQGYDLSKKGVILPWWRSFFQFQMSNFGGSD